jgi:hypothetical protein
VDRLMQAKPDQLLAHGPAGYTEPPGCLSLVAIGGLNGVRKQFQLDNLISTWAIARSCF